jgi:pathogenesis-related protein 1
MKPTALSILLLVCSLPLAAQKKVPSATGSKVNQKDGQAALEFHNQARKDVKTPPLEWSVELAKYAQAWADNLAKNNCAFEHRPHSGAFKQIHGENIFWGSASSYTALNATENWYSEIKDFKPGPLKSEGFSKVGHYTQMVWKTTTHVGIGQAVCKGGEILIVANYSPAGNYMGQSPY